MDASKREMIREEQTILDDLIERMEKVGYSLQRTLTGSVAKLKNAKESYVAEAYGSIVDASNSIKSTKNAIKEFRRSRDELYDTRLILDYINSSEQGEDDLKVGLHGYEKNGEIYVISWVAEACRPFILNDSLTESDCVVIGKHGERFITHYTLKLKRQIDMEFDVVRDVTHLFPLITEEEEQIIADEFLKELLKRRSEVEFQNIVFSIQKQQGEIIQTPFSQNMIVQGCAGSGKSMIMLHRLPIILFDNPNALDRNNLYIITPSITYIQMANNMRIDLEIEDLKMGTLIQYYEHVIAKYGRSPEEYGPINYSIRLTKEQKDFVYSEEAFQFIRDFIDREIDYIKIDCDSGLQLFGLEKRELGNSIPSRRLRNKLLDLQQIIQSNNEVIRRSYYVLIRDCIEDLSEVSRMLSSRKTAVVRGVQKRISDEQASIESARKELSRLDPEQNKVAYENRQKTIEAAASRIIEFTTVLEGVESATEYFDILKELANSIEKEFRYYGFVAKEWQDVGIDRVYAMIEKKDLLCDCFSRVSTRLQEIGDLYWEFAGPMSSLINKAETDIRRLEKASDEYVSLKYLKSLTTASDYFSTLEKQIVGKTYLALMSKLRKNTDDGKKLTALTCSPFLYLLILYQFQGAPNSAKETLITIDEAQNLEPAELRLIYNVNDKKVIFNLFGDVKQHFEGSKGVDSWSDFSPIIDYHLYEMRENYRNARQITRYCNQAFNMNMRAINTDGRGVHKLNGSSLYEQCKVIFQRTQNPGISCIIVKSGEEAAEIYRNMGFLQIRIHNMAENPGELINTKWNLMTVDQAKGLEFETVIAVSGRMSANEKYVAYTRALDELFIFDEEIEVTPAAPVVSGEQSEDIGNQRPSLRKKRIKRGAEKGSNQGASDISVKEFFEQAGVEVIDGRSKGGYLWIVGDKDIIENIVNQAIEIYGISGVYSSGKATHFRPGWYTNTRK